MGWARAVLALVAVVAAGALVVSGGSGADPETPRGLPGMAPPFLGTAIGGDGGLTAAIDSYGNVVDLRAPGPAGGALIDNPAERQAAGTAPVGTGIVPRVQVDGGPSRPLWRADSVRQLYLPGTNVVMTIAEFSDVRVVVKEAAMSGALAILVRAWPRNGRLATARVSVNLERPARCRRDRDEAGLAFVCDTRGERPRWEADELIVAAERRDRRWLQRARPLGAGAPTWARRLHERSLLVLRALTDRRTGAVAAGARDGWAYVWPRDAGAAALAYAAAGYRAEARRVVRFLLRLDLGAAARFHGDGGPAPDRGPQGDATGWTRVAARAAGLPTPQGEVDWRDLPDYQEKESGDYLGNAIAAAHGTKWEISAGDGTKSAFYGAKSSRGLVRRLGDPSSGLDSAAAWAVRPFPAPELYPAARRTMRQLARAGGPFGITPSEDWPEEDPCSAPTAWTAWSFAALSNQETHSARARDDRRAALHLLAALRRSATSAGTLPERVGARTGVPRSTTPLAWSHAFAILALRARYGAAG
jgi:hypothetical protein